MYTCHLFLISSASVRSIPFLSFIEPISAWNVPLFTSRKSLIFLKRSLVFPIRCFPLFLCTDHRGSLFISPCYSLAFCTQMGISFLSPLPFTSLLFSAICKASSDNHFTFLHLFFLAMDLITASCTMSWISVHSSSGTLSDLIPWIYLPLPQYNCKGFDLGHTWMVLWFSLLTSI